MKLASVLLVTLTLVFGGFFGGTAFAGKSVSVAYSSVGDANPWFNAFSKDLEKEAKKRGHKYRVTHAQSKVEKQLADVEDMMVLKPDILILGPVDVVGSAAALPIAKKAGIPVLVVNRDIKGEVGKDYITRIHSDFKFIGASECDIIYSAFGPDKEIKVVELHGTPGGGNTIDMSKGFRERMKKYPNMKIVSSQLGDYNIATAMKSMENIIQSGIEFNAVFGHFDTEALGAIQALKSAGREIGSDPSKGEIVVVGNGGIVDALKAIKAGDYYGLITVSPYYASQVFDAIEAYFAGKSQPEYIRVDDFVIDKSNVDENMWFGF